MTRKFTDQEVMQVATRTTFGFAAVREVADSWYPVLKTTEDLERMCAQAATFGYCSLDAFLHATTGAGSADAGD